jgi:hypothetical protein
VKAQIKYLEELEKTIMTGLDGKKEMGQKFMAKGLELIWLGFRKYLGL